MKTTLLGAALAFALFFAPQAALAQQCSMTVDEAIALMTGSGVEYEIIEDPTVIASLAEQVLAITGLPLGTGAVRALRGHFDRGDGVGFEDAAGCLTPNPVMIPKPVNA